MKKVRPWLGLYLWVDGARLKEIEGQLDAQKEKDKKRKPHLNGVSADAILSKRRNSSAAD
ncbi:MAG: hypothetical protein AAGG68_04620 [Bacteroidota bacterium]